MGYSDLCDLAPLRESPVLRGNRWGLVELAPQLEQIRLNPTFEFFMNATGVPGASCSAAVLGGGFRHRPGAGRFLGFDWQRDAA